MGLQIAWACNAEIMLTDRGLYLWTSSYYKDGHIFRPIKDHELWEWGFSA